MLDATSRAKVHPLGLHVTFATLLSLLIGCASTTHIYVQSTEKTNHGNTLYVVVRAVDGKTIGTESYGDVAANVFTDPMDKSVIRREPIFPGNTMTLTIDDPGSRDIVLYFFFTDPGQNWRVPLHQPIPAEVYVDLGEHQVERVQIRKR